MFYMHLKLRNNSRLKTAHGFLQWSTIVDKRSNWERNLIQINKYINKHFSVEEFVTMVLTLLQSKKWSLWTPSALICGDATNGSWLPPHSWWGDLCKNSTHHLLMFDQLFSSYLILCLFSMCTLNINMFI